MRNRTRRLTVALLGGTALALYSCGGGGGGGGGSGAGNVPRFAYVANFADDTISIFTVNAATGQLRNNGYILAGLGPRSVAVDPSGKFAYVVNARSSDVSAYSIESSAGTLTEIDQNGAASGTTVTTGPDPVAVVVDPSGRFVYVANAGGGVSAFSIASTGASAGALTKIPCGAPSVCSGTDFGSGTSQAIAIDPSGRFAYVANGNGGGASAYGIAPDGGLLAINCGGAACNGTDFAAGAFPVSVDIDPSGRFVYAANINSNDVSAFGIGATGALTK